MKCLLVFLYLTFFHCVQADNIWGTITSTPNFSSLESALTNCGDCDGYTNANSGLLLFTDGNFLAADNSVTNIGTVTQARLGTWYFSNVTLHAPIVPLTLSLINNDDVIPNYNAQGVRFNKYGTKYTANGIPITSEITCNKAAVSQIIWETSIGTVEPLLATNAFDTINGDAALTTFHSGITGSITIVNRLINLQVGTTVFAPTDTAFTALASELYNRLDLFSTLVKTPVATRYSNILNYHLVATTYWKAGLANAAYTSLQGAAFNINGQVITDSQTRTATITAFDIAPSNGVIHKIDHVLLPEPLPTFATTLDDWDSWQTNPKFTSFRTSAQGTGFFDEFLSNTSALSMTFIAPTTGATTLALQLNHIINGVYFKSDLTNDLVVPTLGGSTLRFNLYDTWFVNGRQLNTDFMDWVTVNGALHVSSGGAAIPFFTQTLWDKIPTGKFKDDLQANGLDTVLSGDGGFTVLVPDTTAYSQVTVTPDLVKFHVVSSTIFKPNAGLYPTLQGTLVNLTAAGQFDGVLVTSWDVTVRGATNGMLVNLQGVLPAPPSVQTTSAFPTVTTQSSQQTTVEQVTTAASQTTGSDTVNDSSASSLSILSLFSVFLCIITMLF